MEYLDVLDEAGNKIGLVKERALVHRDGDWHGAVHIWIINSKGELLLQRRSPDRENNPNMWDVSAAGHIASGDSANVTALRKVKEELGIEIELQQLEHLFRVNQQSERAGYINNEINDVYLVAVDMDVNAFKLQKEEVAEIKYMSLSEVEELVNQKNLAVVVHEAEYEKLFNYLHSRYPENQ